MLVLPLHLLSIAAIFYALFTAARTLKSVELRRPAGFGEYLVDLLLLWFFPVGLWLIQPRVQRLLSAA